MYAQRGAERRRQDRWPWARLARALGAVYEYRCPASGFGGTTGSTVLDAADATAAGFGTAVALNADGSKLAAGALYDSAGAANSGAVYLFDNSNLAAISRGAALTGERGRWPVRHGAGIRRQR
jgi:hypothetical protein